MAVKKKVLAKGELDAQLNKALEQSFPASDPVTIGTPTSTEPDRPAERRAPLLDKGLVKELAAQAGKKRKAD